MKKRRLGGFHKAESLALYYIYFDLPPLSCGKSTEWIGGFAHLAKWWEAKLGGVSGEEGLALLCCSGCEEECWLFDSEALRGSSLTASCGDHQRRRFCVVVILDLRGRSVLRCCMRCSVFNLQARVPMRRPSSSSMAAFIVVLAPSGFVPGGGADGHHVELFVEHGGEGLNCVPLYFLEVLFVKDKGLVVISFYLEVLDVNCMPTV